MLLWVLMQGARVSHPGPHNALHSRLSLFWTAQVVLFWPLGLDSLEEGAAVGEGSGAGSKSLVPHTDVLCPTHEGKKR